MCPLTRAVGLLALLAGAGFPAASQETPDTAVVVRGFLQRDTLSGRWTILLPEPLAALGIRAFELTVARDEARWDAYENRYVEAVGRVSPSPPAKNGTPGLKIRLADMKEVEPRGTARRAVNRGPVWHALVTLAVIPDRFAWVDRQGNSTGVSPVLLYSIVDKQQGAIVMQLPTDEMLCLGVKPEKGPAHWSDTTWLKQPGARRFVIPHGGTYREAIPLPPGAASQPGRYVARAGICRIGDYDVSAKFEVQ